MLLNIQLHILLLIVLVIFALMGFLWLFWPKKGGLATLKQLRKSNLRVHLEDALKFLFDCEYRKVSCDINSLAGNLGLGIDVVGKIMNRLATMNLVTVNNSCMSLTDTGRSYALRVIRVHRIWERYLADETGLSPAEWHTKACEIEHHVTMEETEKLAANMGHPVFDPHGDPIPTAEGELPKLKGKNLTEIQEGQMARVIHIEDEPKSIFEQLYVLGLYPGMEIYVTDVTDTKITFVANGEEVVLTTLFASYLTVVELAKQAEMNKTDLLSSLKIGEQAQVVGLSPHCRGQQRRRLMDFGIVPGSRVSAVMKSASGDPIGYRVMGTTIGIRKQQADMVFINR